MQHDSPSCGFQVPTTRQFKQLTVGQSPPKAQREDSSDRSLKTPPGWATLRVQFKQKYHNSVRPAPMVVVLRMSLWLGLLGRICQSIPSIPTGMPGVNMPLIGLGTGGYWARNSSAVYEGTKLGIRLVSPPR